MINMSDTRVRPSPAYCAGDCILIGSRIQGASESPGDHDYFRQVNYSSFSYRLHIELF